MEQLREKLLEEWGQLDSIVPPQLPEVYWRVEQFGRVFHVVEEALSADITNTKMKCLDFAVGAFSKAIGAAVQDKTPSPRVGTNAPITQQRIFIGHGGSTTWKALRELLRERLNLEVEEYSTEPTAGIATKEQLLEMLGNCSFAFLVMTAEDEHGNGTKHARENVVHEISLLQGRYGSERAIVLLEDGCTEFSNISGIGQIRFPKDDITAKSEDFVFWSVKASSR